MLMKKEKMADGKTKVTAFYNDGELALECYMKGKRIEKITTYYGKDITLSLELNKKGDITGELITYDPTHYYNSHSTWKDGVCIDPGDDEYLEMGSTIDDNAEELPDWDLATDLDSYIDWVAEDDYDEVTVDLNAPEWKGYKVIQASHGC